MSDEPVIRSDELRARNRHRLLSTLRLYESCSRAELSRVTGLSAASVSTLTAQLIEEGVIRVDKRASAKARDTGAHSAGDSASESPGVAGADASEPGSSSGPTRRGRPQNTLSLSASACSIITASLSIDRLTVRLSDYSGRSLADQDHTLDTRALSADHLQDTLVTRIERLIGKHKATPESISVAFQGVTDNRSGAFLWSPIIRARDVPVRQCLADHFDIPVSVNHDCRLIANALHHRHQATLGDNFAAVLFSHGIGMGLYLDGSVFSGTRSSGLELGHLLYRVDGALCRCGRQGCIEAYAADYAIARRVQELESPTGAPAGRVPEAMMSRIIERAQQGDPTACTAFNEAGKAVGYGLAHVFTLFDPMPIALIGLSDASFALMKDALQEGVQLVHRTEADADHDIHCFKDPEPLLQHGLIIDALHTVDRLLAENPRTESVA